MLCSSNIAINSIAPDATIHNTNNSFTQSLLSGSDTQLPDIRLTILNSLGNKILIESEVSNIDLNMDTQSKKYQN